MKKLVTIAAACAVAMSLGVTGAFAVPGKGQGPSNNPGEGKQKANGNGAPTAKSVAAQLCKAQKQAIGSKAFKGLHGKSAGSNCIQKQVRNGNGLAKNAAHECKAEMADPDFPDKDDHAGLTFWGYYGTNHNDRNAFGKCVSRKVHELIDGIRNNLLNAAQLCREERATWDPNAGDHDGKSYAEYYGKNNNMKNAFGKCVSIKAKEQSTPPTTP